MSKGEMMELANDTNYTELYNDARTDNNRYVYKLLFGDSMKDTGIPPRLNELCRRNLLGKEDFTISIILLNFNIFLKDATLHTSLYVFLCKLSTPHHYCRMPHHISGYIPLDNLQRNQCLTFIFNMDMELL
jgi:hypothetical protein